MNFKGHKHNNFAVKFLDDNVFVSGGKGVISLIWDIRMPLRPLLSLPGYLTQIGDF